MTPIFENFKKEKSRSFCQLSKRFKKNDFL